MRNTLRFMCSVGAFAMLLGCSMGEAATGEFQPNPVNVESGGPETPPDERVALLLQEAKQSYDDRYYEQSFRLAEKAQTLILENQFPIEDEVMALNIQGYCLLQLGRIDDYFISGFGVQKGAITKFGSALKYTPTDYRARLGVALARFRRHGDTIRKAETLGSGALFLEQAREDTRRGFRTEGEEGKELLRDVQRRLLQFKANREKLVELGYIFNDPSTLPYNDKGERLGAPWLGKLADKDAPLVLNDAIWIIEDAIAGEALTEKDRALALNNLLKLADDWRHVQAYWRKSAMADLQASRDGLLGVRESYKAYFWVDRELVFVYQSIGAFFLDIAMDQARVTAISQGATPATLEAEAKKVFLAPEFDTWEKKQSAKNYKDALSYISSFVIKHREFELSRTEAAEKKSLEDDNGNPFLVDLVQRYRATMDELVSEERNLRALMVLEAASLCVEPLFQISDIPAAISWANQYQAMYPSKPMHHFVRATAYYQGKDWEDALREYRAFLRESSITTDDAQRKICRERILQCERELARAGGAGESAQK